LKRRSVYHKLLCLNAAADVRRKRAGASFRDYPACRRAGEEVVSSFTVRLYHVHHGARKHGKHWGPAGLKAAQQVGDELGFDSQDKAEAFVHQRDLTEGWPGARCKDKGHYIATVTGPDGAVSQWEEGERVGAPKP
jgi:uncharacterized protein involved in type VI secretion and phage assembly